MADVQNTQVINIPITETTVDAVTGVATTVPLRSTDVFTATSTHADGSDASASLAAAVVVAADGTVIVTGTPLVLESDAANAGGGILITVSDNAGDIVHVDGPWNIVPVPVVRTIAGGVPTFTPNPTVPTAPGP